ncbi:MAG: 7TM-DISM domain-containing protein, partial [Rhodoferax sp.]
MRRALRLLLCLALCAVLPLAALAAQPLPLELTEQNQADSLWPNVQLLEDRQTTLTLQDVREPEAQARFQTPEWHENIVNLGFTRSAVWLRFVLTNGATAPLRRMLEVGNSNTSHIDLYTIDQDRFITHKLTGSSHPFATRAYANRNFVFPLEVPGGGQLEVYLRLQTPNPMIIGLHLWGVTEFHRYERNDYILQTLFSAAIMALALYSVVVWLTLRDNVYIWYSAYAMLMLLSINLLNGMADEILSIHVPGLSDVLYMFGFMAAVGCFFQFLRLTLNIREKMPHLIPYVNGISLFYLTAVPLMWLDFSRFAPLFIFSIPIFAVFGLGLLVYAAWKKDVLARLMLPGYLVLAIGTQSHMMMAFDLAPQNLFTSNGALIGAGLDMLFFASAIAYRFNMIRREQIDTSRHALQRERKLVEELREHERGLEQEVHKRTLHLIDAQTELQAAKERAEEATRVKSEFLAIMSHEI